MNLIKEATASAGKTNEQRAHALFEATRDPKLNPVALGAGLVNSKADAGKLQMLSNLKKVVGDATDRESKSGTFSNDVESFLETLALSLVSTPPSSPSKPTVGPRALSSATGLSVAAAHRRVKKAVKKRQDVKNRVAGVFWSKKAARKSKVRVTKEVIKAVQEWVLKHPEVVQSPLVNDTLLVPDEDGVKQRVPKHLLRISVWELHNDLMNRDERVGCPAAYDADGNLIISDTTLRNIMPKNVKRITERHKQLCGCEPCIAAKTLHESLLHWRTKHSKDLKREMTRLQQDNSEAANTRLSDLNRRWSKFVQQTRDGGRNPKHPTAKDAAFSFLCQPCNGGAFRKWKCVLGRCDDCPGYEVPDEESGTGPSDKKIKFHSHEDIYSCSLHKSVVSKTTKLCPLCEEERDNIVSEHGEDEDLIKSKTGKVKKKKSLVLKVATLGDFHKSYYKPVMEKFAHHLSYVSMLGKKWTEEDRFNSFSSSKTGLFTREDYAEQIQFLLDLELQAMHWVGAPSLSVEGMACHLFKSEEDESPTLTFHSHLADNSLQNAATTTTHLNEVFNQLFEEKLLKKGDWIWDHTDGCSKQYRCAKAFYFLSWLSHKWGVVIDRAIGAPGHGKDIVDAINAVDKRLLRDYMRALKQPNESNEDTRKRFGLEGHLFSQDLTQAGGDEEQLVASVVAASFADQASKLLGAAWRFDGVKGGNKNRKRETQRKLKERYYHLQKEEDVKFLNVAMKMKGFDSAKGSGPNSHYNFRFDPDLPIMKCAVRRIPCACEGCVAQLKKPWVPGVEPEKQERYSPTGFNCKHHELFEGLNDWRIVEMVPAEGECDMEELQDSYLEVLDGLVDQMTPQVKVGNVGAVNVDDDDGFYLVRWTGVPSTQQEDEEWDTTDGGSFVPAGEVVCEGHYLMKVGGAKNWFTDPVDDSQNTKVMMKHVLHPDLSVEGVSEENRLPHSCNVAEAVDQNPVKLSDHDFQLIQDLILSREVYDQDLEDPRCSDSDSEDSTSEG